MNSFFVLHISSKYYIRGNFPVEDETGNCVMARNEAPAGLPFFSRTPLNYDRTIDR